MLSTEPSASRRTSSRPLDFPVELCCPACKGPVRWEGDVGRCSSCGPVAALRGGRIPDFLGSQTQATEVIWTWPDDFNDRLAPLLLDARAGVAIGPDPAAELQTLGLLDRESHLTALGDNVCYHLGEYRVQEKQEEFLHPRFLETLSPDSKVLDIGCGAGQTLRRLEPYGPPERVGVDINLDALALGGRLRESEGQDIHLVRSSGYTLPFPDRQFTHVFCRVALALMHQRRALAEMVRVLQPGGFLYCHIEGPGFGLRCVLQSSHLKQFVCWCRDLMLGLTLQATGWQPVPGSRFRGGIVYGTAGRVKKNLRRAGCEVLHAEVSYRYLGLPYGYKVLAVRKEG